MTAELTEYRVTFGQKYRREPHPTFPKAHPDGWVSVWAHDEDEARQITVKRLGSAWAFLYGPDTWDPWWYPLGNLATWRLAVIAPEFVIDATWPDAAVQVAARMDVAEARVQAGLALAARIESEALYYTDRKELDAVITVRRIRIALGLEGAT